MNLTGLVQEDNHFVNKKVVIKKPGSHGHKFDYTYKIKDGITTAEENIVEEMLTDKGIL